MNTFELIEKLAEKPKEEIKYALLALLLKDKIDFFDLNTAYVEYLKEIKEDRLLYRRALFRRLCRLQLKQIK